MENFIMKRIAIFVHYDKDNIVDDYVLYYLRELKKVSNEIIFVSDCNLSEEEQKKLSDICLHVIAKKHGEYDFGSYKRGIQYLQNSTIQYDLLILANDSCYGPINELEPIFSNIKLKNYDFWGMTLNKEGRDDAHVQSYFMVFNRKISSSDVFKDFFNGVESQTSREQVIEKYEIGLSHILSKSGFKMGAFLNIAYDSAPMISEKLFTEVLPFGVPFIKIELLKKNPCNLNNVNDYKKFVERDLLKIINLHQGRVNTIFDKITLLLQKELKIFLRFLFQKKSSDKKIIIKIIKVPVFFSKKFFLNKKNDKF